MNAVPADPVYLGLDVGGTKIAVGLMSEARGVFGTLRTSTASLRADGRALEALIALGRRVHCEAGCPPLTGVGLALPGPVDRASLTMLAAPTIPEFAGASLLKPLEEAFGCPAGGDNDANGCALAESRFGAGRGYPSVLYVTVSTGIGGGVVIDGRVYRGATGTAAEFGHQVILRTGGPPCDCGGSGCLETLASGRGVSRLARRLYGDNRERPADELADLARAGDGTALEVWDEAGAYLGAGISNLINLFDPGVILLGGGVGCGAFDLLEPRLSRFLAARCMPTLTRRTPILRAALGEDLGVASAVALVQERLQER
jgi:glucokinase